MLIWVILNTIFGFFVVAGLNSIGRKEIREEYSVETCKLYLFDALKSGGDLVSFKKSYFKNKMFEALVNTKSFIEYGLFTWIMYVVTVGFAMLIDGIIYVFNRTSHYHVYPSGHIRLYTVLLYLFLSVITKRLIASNHFDDLKSELDKKEKEIKLKKMGL